MDDPKPLPLTRATAAAERIVSELTPHALRIVIAGSIRRRRPQVNDIDLVIEASNQEAILARVKEKGIVITGDDPAAQNTIVRLGDYQLDLFFAHGPSEDLIDRIPGNWGSMLLCRTGSKQHNISICKLAEKAGYHWDPYRGIIQGGRPKPGGGWIGGTAIASETEEEIYQCLGIPFRNPVTERDQSF